MSALLFTINTDIVAIDPSQANTAIKPAEEGRESSGLI